MSAFEENKPAAAGSNGGYQPEYNHNNNYT